MTEPIQTSVQDTLSEIRGLLESLNATPNVTPPAPVVAKGVADQGTTAPSRIMTRGDQFALRRELKTKSTEELHALFSMQAGRKDVGIPFEVWANAGGYSVQSVLQQNDMLSKALDTGGATALIRQDLEPVLYELFVRTFPAYERFPKEPANGLVHAFNQITAYGGAVFMPELGTVTDDTNTYVRQTTNVGILATRRGISLKSQFAVTAGGMNYDPLQLELAGGLRAISHTMQKQIFQGQSTNSGGTAANELGLYDANAFTGLRDILNQSQAQNCDPTAATPDDMRKFIDLAATSIMNSGGVVNIIWCRPDEKTTFDLQQDKNVRYMNNFVNVAPGVLTNAVNTVFGPLPLATVPGDSIGSYTAATYSGNTVSDMYLLDESTISLPYLGTDGPTVLDIPIGISGQLTHLYIIFGMWGLAVKAVPFSTKVRVKHA